MTTKHRYNIDPKVKILRTIESGAHKFMEIFQGFDELAAVHEIFGDNTRQELTALTVEVFPRDGFMGVSDEDGHIFASQSYLNQGEIWSVYLDIIHELTHVKQFREGKELFDPRYDYVDRPTEIEAYRIGTREARRIGMTDEEIFSYLEVPWITKEEHLRLAKTCKVKIDSV